ncbi:hypothetical protein PIB30_090010 [Stylosanthes scabra]|uniref:Uncharacterized protein n=1 Tax=Stylosanthes scabra TaxID=79078 RepID=A0ABU6VUB4_9FABA|nr:hypothetical protein [Stylosanthes scabra]
MEAREKEKECRKNKGKPEKGSRITPPPLRKKEKKEGLKPAKKKKKHEEVKSRKKKKKCKEYEDEERITLKCSSLGNLLGKLKKIEKALRNNQKMDAHLVKDQSKWKGQLCVFKHVETRFQPFILHFPPSETTILSSSNPRTHSPLSLIFIIIIVHHHNHQQRKRCCKATLLKDSWYIFRPLNLTKAERFETPTYAERGQILSERKVLHERTINFHGKQDTKNQREVYIRGRKIPCYLRDIEGVLYIPRLEGKSEHKALGEKIMVTAMNEDPTKSKKQLLPFPMFITKWAERAGVPTYPGDEISNVPKALWKEEREAADDPIPPPMPSPVRPPVTRTNTPAPSNRSSPHPSKKELMRALRRNERIMHRHEQLLLMLHPGTDISQLEQISSPEVTEHQQ